MRHLRFYTMLMVLAVPCAARPCSAAFLFSSTSDTISISGSPLLSSQATYEAEVEFNSTSYASGIDNSYSGGGGVIYNAWVGGLEDQALAILNGGTLFGEGYPVGDSVGMTGGSLQTGVWYDLAYVYNGQLESLYINGTLVASVSTTGNIQSQSNALTVVGATHRDGMTDLSFLGEIQSLRISNVARYSGSSYTPTTGDFSDDSSTLLLYDFDNPAVGNTVTDLSGHGHTGTLGTGFTGAMSPTFVAIPEPASIGIFCFVTGACLARRRR